MNLHGDADTAPLLRRRKLPDAEMDITPMIDVTFLLLIFFMVSSTMRPDSSKDIDLPAAKYGVGVPKPNATMIVVRAPGKIENDKGQPLDAEGIKRLVAERVRRNHRHVILQAERQVPMRIINDVTRAIMEVDGAEFFAAVLEKKE